MSNVVTSTDCATIDLVRQAADSMGEESASAIICRALGRMGVTRDFAPGLPADEVRVRSGHGGTGVVYVPKALTDVLHIELRKDENLSWVQVNGIMMEQPILAKDIEEWKDKMATAALAVAQKHNLCSDFEACLLSLGITPKTQVVRFTVEMNAREGGLGSITDLADLRRKLQGNYYVETICANIKEYEIITR